MIDIPVKYVSDEFRDIPLPEYMTEGSSGMDLRAAVREDTILEPMKIMAIPTGFCIGIPVGYEGQVRPRSGLALKNGVTVLNTPGTIDSDYRGEVKVIMINLGPDDFIIKRGDRIAQLVITPVIKVNIIENNNLTLTNRGEGGFGHTGK